MTSQELLETTDLNWGVRPETMVTESGLIVPKKIALIREDNNTILGVHGDGYVPYQNHELMELLFQISQSTGLAVHSSGLFDGGEKVWIQLKSDSLTLGKDKIDGFISGVNSFDGSTSLAFGNANLTISCRNTFWLGYKQLDTKLRHSSSMKGRIEEILKSMDVLLEEEKDIFEQIVRMNEVGYTPKMVDLVKQRLFDVKPEDLTPDNIKELSTRKTNQLFRFEQDLDIELASKDQSIWGLFSGVTRYTTHSSTRDLSRNHENKMFGRTGTIERALFHDLSKMAGIPLVSQNELI